ncbi:MAG: FAD-binding protein, partial [Polyangiaceae bacterium]|nr:FAD-binding protein [Polyangiaceae bacterium]
MARALPDHIDLILGLDESEDPSSLREKVASKLGCALEDVPETYPERRSIDARKGRVKILLRVVFEAPHDRAELGLPDPIEVKPPSRVIIVGDGPAGLFCAYELARRGIACTVVDRGKEVQPRRRDLALLNRGERIDEDSNYCFGEGGAGTYSDGKLYTRAGKRGDIRDVIEVLARHGAPSAILTDARPHIGSNKLPRVITAMREQLRGLGVEIRFESRVEALLTEPGTSGKRIAGVRFANGQELEARAVVLATGHSARDVYTMLD